MQESAVDARVAPYFWETRKKLEFKMLNTSHEIGHLESDFEEKGEKNLLGKK